MSRARPPRPITGRMVFFMMVAFFGVVIGVNLIMMRLAIQTLPGTGSIAPTAPASPMRRRSPPRAQSARNWKVDAHVERSEQGGATLRVEARDNDGRPMSGLKFQGRFERPTDRRADLPVALAEVGIGIYRGARRHRAGPMGSGARRRRGGTAAVSVQEPRVVELGRPDHAGDARFSHYVRHLGSGLSHIDLAVEGVNCAGCMSKIERGLSALPDVTLARVNLTDRRVALEWKEGTLDPARFIDRLAELGYKAYPFEPVRAEADETEQASFLLRCLGVAAFAAMNIMMLSIPFGPAMSAT